MRIIDRIELAVDHHEGAEFCEWLNEHGYAATVGRSTGNYIDGASTSTDDGAGEVLRELWHAYCSE